MNQVALDLLTHTHLSSLPKTYQYSGGLFRMLYCESQGLASERSPGLHRTVGGIFSSGTVPWTVRVRAWMDSVTRADLVDLEQERVAGLLLDRGLHAAGVGHQQVIAHHLRPRSRSNKPHSRPIIHSTRPAVQHETAVAAGFSASCARKQLP